MHTDRKPFAQSCEENKEPILEVLRPILAGARHLLEIGSGTGQHAVHFATRLPHLTWQTSDVAENLPGIRLWLAEAGLPNLPPPLELDVTRFWPPGMADMPGAQEHPPARPAGAFDAAFSANTIHIMSDTEVRALFAGLPGLLVPGAPFAVYGPFNYGGRHTSDSNARFDRWLKARDPASGIKDRDLLAILAEAQGMQLEEDHPMPCNNRILVFRRTGQ